MKGNGFDMDKENYFKLNQAEGPGGAIVDLSVSDFNYSNVDLSKNFGYNNTELIKG